MRFRFRLQRALEWRRTQFEIEQAAYRRELAAMSDLDGQKSAIEAEWRNAQDQVRSWRDVSGGDLGALELYRHSVEIRMASLAVKLQQAAVRVAGRQRSMVDAKRRYRLLDRLKEKRIEEWRAEEQRALEEAAAESHLAQYCRNRAMTDATSI